MNSMTGYGRGAASQGQMEIVVEITGVNRKNLDIGISVPREWALIEQALAERLRGQIGRGKVQVSVSAKGAASRGALDWDDEQVAALLQRLRETSRRVSGEVQADGALLLQLIAMVRENQQPPEAEELLPSVQTAFDSALAGFLEMRQTEGTALREDLRQRLGLLENLLQRIETQREGMVEAYRERLFQRLRQAGLELDLDDERVQKEIALFADRADIEEEITRLRSHFEQVASALDASEPVGRKLDFIIQEINREFNTIGSKAHRLDITQAVIEAKNELERFREQTANVE